MIINKYSVIKFTSEFKNCLTAQQRLKFCNLPLNKLVRYKVLKNYDEKIDEITGSHVISQILANRGFDTEEKVKTFLNPMSYPISSPYNFTDMKGAVDRISQAVTNQENIVICGDFDCDGVTSTSVLYKTLLKIGAKAGCYIPNRKTESHGLNSKAIIEIISKQKAKLIITVDNGIASIKEIEYATSLGIVTVVTDHHIQSENLPDAVAVVDPNRFDCPSDFKQICGAQVAFKVICVTENKEPEELIYEYSDLLAIAIIGDYMPLIKENRCIVKYGIKQIKNNHNIGISAILSVAGIEKTALDSGKVSFGIAPRINAAGRMGDAKRAFELLISDNIMKAISLANEIDADNSNRQKIEKEIFSDAVETIELMQTTGLFQYLNSWSKIQVIGISQNNLCLDIILYFRKMNTFDRS